LGRDSASRTRPYQPSIIEHSNLSALSVNQCITGYLQHGAKRKSDLNSVSTSVQGERFFV
jgi:hypothetical protein